MIRGTAARWLAAAAAAVGVGACTVPPSVLRSDAEDRLTHLAAATRLLASDPATAAVEAAAAGPGGVLESYRFQLWFEALAAADADPDAWRTLLAAAPPETVRARGWRALAERLAARDDHTALSELLATTTPSQQAAADEMQVATDAGPDPAAAARRLAIGSPDRLHRVDPALERSVVAGLSPAERVERSESWRRVGAAITARTELRAFTAAGETENERRRVLARAEIDAGSPSRALSVLPRTGRGAAEDDLERARALRAVAWSRFPARRASAAFRDCAATADQALRTAPRGSATWQDAQQALLECATEGDALDRAVGAWAALTSTGWDDPRRDWLGRRLGVALAQRGRGEAAAVARGLPDDARCIRFWLAVKRNDRATLAELAAVAIPDLYGSWARQQLALGEPAPPALAPAVGTAPATFAVQWLVDHDRQRAALSEWRYLAARRALTPPEALAAAALAVAIDDRFGAIRFVRTAMPALGGVDLAGEPADAVRAYLPLPYLEAVLAAADEQRLAPWLVAAVARQESAFHPRARSPRAARGLMQLLASTARGHARALGLVGAPDLEDPAVNLRLGARELAQLMTRFGAVEPALAAYNAGPARVARWWARTPDQRRFVEEIPIPETYTYVRRVMFLAEAYRQVYHERWRETR